MLRHLDAIATVPYLSRFMHSKIRALLAGLSAAGYVEVRKARERPFMALSFDFVSFDDLLLRTHHFSYDLDVG